MKDILRTLMALLPGHGHLMLAQSDPRNIETPPTGTKSSRPENENQGVEQEKRGTEQEHEGMEKEDKAEHGHSR
ncbi:MAG TPA: hypothetical protein VFA48_01440 [Gammaproteobacteria bacterium]|nr:hypothetical protein [Gammaproteobacteria bacterium]